MKTDFGTYNFEFNSDCYTWASQLETLWNEIFYLGLLSSKHFPKNFVLNRATAKKCFLFFSPVVLI